MNKFFVIVMLAFFGQAFAQLPMSGSKTGTYIDSSVQGVVDAYAAQWGATAVSVVGGKDDESSPRFAACYGWKSMVENAQVGKQCTVNSLFNIASASKQVTAVIIDVLGVDLNRYVFCVPGRLRSNCILSNVISYNGTWPSMVEDVTVRHLRDHTAGMDDGLIGTGGDVNTASQLKIALPLSKVQWASFNAVNWLLYRKPGSKYGYSNTGYFYISMVIEKLTGKSYEQVMHELVTRPRDIRDEDFKVCSNQKTNMKRDSAGNLTAVPTNGFDFRQVWKDPNWDIFTTPSLVSYQSNDDILRSEMRIGQSRFEDEFGDA